MKTEIMRRRAKSGEREREKVATCGSRQNLPLLPAKLDQRGEAH